MPQDREEGPSHLRVHARSSVPAFDQPPSLLWVLLCCLWSGRQLQCITFLEANTCGIAVLLCLRGP